MVCLFGVVNHSFSFLFFFVVAFVIVSVNRYEIGEKYVQHHDYLHHQLHRDPGVRMLTVYMYLNDVVSDTTSGSTTTGGGDTHFHDLGLSVQPKRGRVVIWPSVLDHNTSQIDARTHHEALPVEQGTKYGKYELLLQLHTYE